jgi:poly(3-hydroxybutyrate) depolymerase
VLLRSVAALTIAAALVAATGADAAAPNAVKVLTFVYPTHAGAKRTAYVVLPAWYGSRRHPSIPVVVSPHGRGVSGGYNLRFWGSLPARGPFALISPDGHGRRLPNYSWGWRGQIDDLSRMPALAREAFPWLRLDPRRVYAIGDSMGAQEALLLAARGRPRLAGVAAFDAVSDMAARYRRWFVTPGEERLPALARAEFGGSPHQVPGAYAARSPIAYATAIAHSGVPLQLWWSHRDAVVTDQQHETGSFFERLHVLAPNAPVQEIVGYWQHAREMYPETQLPAALACFGLISPDSITVPAYERHDDGTIQELPPEDRAPPVAFTRSFCGRASP